MRINNKIITKIRKIPPQIILIISICIIIFYYIMNMFNELNLVDFKVYYSASEAFWNGNFTDIYNLEYYLQNSDGVLFVYLPSFCFLLPFITFLPLTHAALVFVVINMILGCINVIFLYKISLKLFKNQFEKTFLIVLIYSLYIQHFWNANIAQRGDLGGFFILCIIYLEFHDIKYKKIIQNLCFLFLFTLYVYMILAYLIWIAYKKDSHNVVIGVVLFILLNFPLLFYLTNLSQLLDYAQYYFMKEANSFSTYPLEYTIIGLLYIITKFDLTLISMIFITISAFLIYIKGDKQDFLTSVAYLSFSFLFLNKLIHGLHILMLFPLILLFVFQRVDFQDLKVSELLGLLGLLLIMFPIPHILFEVLSLGEFAFLKRGISYLLFIPILLKQSKNLNRNKENIISNQL